MILHILVAHENLCGSVMEKGNLKQKMTTERLKKLIF